jgi:chromosome segregation ATPase
MSEENMVAGANPEVDTLEERLRQAANEIDHLTNSFNKTTEDLSRIKNMLDVDAIRGITSTIQRFEGQLSAIEKQREEAYQGAQKYSEELEKEKERLIKLWDAYKKQEEELSTAEGKLQEYEDRTHRAEQQKQQIEEDYTARIDTLNQKLDDQQGNIEKIDQYQQQINECTNVRNTLEQENQGLKQENAEHKETINSLQQSLEEYKKYKDYADYKNKYDDANNAYEKEKDRLTKLYHLYEETEREVNQLRQQNKQWEEWFNSNKEIFDKLFSEGPPFNHTTNTYDEQTTTPPTTDGQDFDQTQYTDKKQKKKGFLK